MRHIVRYCVLVLGFLCCSALGNAETGKSNSMSACAPTWLRMNNETRHKAFLSLPAASVGSYLPPHQYNSISITTGPQTPTLDLTGYATLTSSPTVTGSCSAQIPTVNGCLDPKYILVLLAYQPTPATLTCAIYRRPR